MATQSAAVIAAQVTKAERVSRIRARLISMPPTVGSDLAFVLTLLTEAEAAAGEFVIQLHDARERIASLEAQLAQIARKRRSR